MQSQTRRRQNVEVNADHDIEGNVVPQKITLKDGRVFHIEKVKGVAKVAILSQFATTTQYTVKIKGRETSLYEDGGKWFVEMHT